MRLILIVLISIFAKTAQADTAILFLVDASASMRSEVSSSLSRWSVVQGVLINDLLAMPKESKVGLRVFGHRESESNAKKSCADSELLQPISFNSEINWQAKLSSLKPKGLTALSYSLQQAGQDLLSISAERKVLILLSDGVESCGGKPDEVVSKLKAEGLDLVFHVIGFLTDANADRQLNTIAKVMGGSYQKADSAVQLLESLAGITYSVLPPETKAKWQGVSEIGDAGKPYDSDVTSKIEIVSDVQYQASLGSFDTVDHYSFLANQGEKFVVSVSGLKNSKHSLEIFYKSSKVFNSDASDSLEDSSEVFTAEHAGDYDLVISLKEPTQERFKYSISLVKQVSFN